MKKKVFTLNGRKFYSEEEYIKAREALLHYQNEQEKATAQFGFASGIVILASEQSKVIRFEQK